jgi:hypothetical protein
MATLPLSDTYFMDLTQEQKEVTFVPLRALLYPSLREEEPTVNILQNKHCENDNLAKNNYLGDTYTKVVDSYDSA